MVKGDSVYTKHFYNMVTCGIVCGLDHPIEWLLNYDRCIGESYDKYGEVSEFIILASHDLYQVTHEMLKSTQEDVDKWVDEFYHNDTALIQRTLSGHL
jgi:hypothetical protein